MRAQNCLLWLQVSNYDRDDIFPQSIRLFAPSSGVRVTAWAGMYGTMSLAAALLLSFIVKCGILKSALTLCHASHSAPSIKFDSSLHAVIVTFPPVWSR